MSTKIMFHIISLETKMTWVFGVLNRPHPLLHPKLCPHVIFFMSWPCVPTILEGVVNLQKS